MTDRNKILLESGTNELEMIEFEMGKNKYGINVIKVKEIIMPGTVTPIPHAHPYIKGIIQLRGEVLPVINMEKVLNLPQEKCPTEKFIVTEFNQQKVCFRVHNVTQIHRISWEQIEKPSDMYSAADSQVIGVVKREEDMILMLDFEKIITDINPETGINIQKLRHLGERERSDKRIVVAEDSSLLRKLLIETLEKAGYVKVQCFENGKDVYNYLDTLLSETTDILKEVQLVITDIEMPLMDGHHLTKKIKEHDQLSKIPVIIFSSLITESLFHKGVMVGADDQVSKPEIEKLVEKIDQYIL
ncbi:chemotaxis protein [Heyndrickxia acidicola]|uniref:Chemotaxis protein n=1 Tax=Heyndrickxia acidicola TaxID=209389 RepID=A0ABU6MJS4_9BACI|nr:chemotaxis protein [Heyndrickxia acidicola]MED1204261.1 chemotaxis protein [Heyndrickxia acidicola]